MTKVIFVGMETAQKLFMERVVGLEQAHAAILFTPDIARSRRHIPNRHGGAGKQAPRAGISGNHIGMSWAHEAYERLSSTDEGDR